MAQQPFIQTYIPAFTPDVKAATDLRSYQWFCVQFNATGVRLASTFADSGPYYVLTNQPNSGQPCTLESGPNIVKTVVASTVNRNQWVSVQTSAMVGPVDIWGNWVGSGNIIGRALTATVNGSGELISVKLL